MKKYAFPVLMWVLFETLAATLWLTLDNIFYLFNFSYIGTFLALGIAFYLEKIKYTRSIVQFAVGLYMLVYFGILSNENMQIEGFCYYLFLGVLFVLYPSRAIQASGLAGGFDSLYKQFQRFQLELCQNLPASVRGK
ncbi:hypothetical protein [Marasmitruncus massiliensis]|uniref:hypothetical protein n=1 Tax=Marasmitruncus massiliensis TaxID=1944642 RepID=UPI000C7C8D80